MSWEVITGDCLEVLPTLPDGIADAIITDLPYGTTACSWDAVIPFEPMWEQVRRLLKPRGAFVTTASQPFTSKLVMSNIDWFRYEWVWTKRRVSGFLNANRRPLSAHEAILVFGNTEPTYSPQMRKGRIHKRNRERRHEQNTEVYSGFKSTGVVWTDEYYPLSYFEFAADPEVTITRKQRPNKMQRHPTQKPVALYEYLIRTYTNEGDMVLDFTCGSGTTGVAAINTGRNFIGVELREDYADIARRRCEKAAAQAKQMELQL